MKTKSILRRRAPLVISLTAIVALSLLAWTPPALALQLTRTALSAPAPSQGHCQTRHCGRHHHHHGHHWTSCDGDHDHTYYCPGHH